MLRRDNSRGGIVLLETIVALTILAVGGLSVVTLAMSSLAAIERARIADESSQQASQFLDAVSLWTRADLDRHLGDRPEGQWRLRIERPVPTLYVVSLRDSITDRSLFTTSLYRVEAPHGAP
jgi:type II secretory pathway pseudopilin PulG